MAYNPENLLPTEMRGSDYSDIVKVVYDFLNTDYRQARIDRIKNKYDFEAMSKEDALEFLYEIGWRLTQTRGYTETLTFLKKQVETAVKRILRKTCRPAYLYEFYCYLVSGEPYPLLYKTDSNGNYLQAWDNWQNDPEFIEKELVLDSINELTGNNYTLDEVVEWTLDFFDVINSVTRHILLRYEHRFVEGGSEDTFDASVTNPPWHSVDTAYSFWADVHNVKKHVQTPHFEAVLKLKVPADLFSNNAFNVVPYYSDYVVQGSRYTNDVRTYRLTAVDLNGGFDLVKLGDGRTNAPQTLSGDIVSPVGSFNPSDAAVVYWDTLTPTKLAMGFRLSPGFRLFGSTSDIKISEIGFFLAGNLSIYATFPEINFHKNQLCSIYFDIELI